MSDKRTETVHTSVGMQHERPAEKPIKLLAIDTGNSLDIPDRLTVGVALDRIDMLLDTTTLSNIKFGPR
ncbi:hypothetical protein CA601_15320 [Paraburkholderia hospita]|nr:hypothetical protein CA601_15320 [Paraburkholderia hospita]